MLRRVAQFLFLVFLLSACGGNPGNPSIASQAGKTSSPTQPVSAPQETALIGISATVLGGELLNPIPPSSQSPEKAATSTKEPTSTPEPSSTPTPPWNSKPTLTFKINCEEESRDYSPDEFWIAVMCKADGRKVITKVFSIDGKISWDIQPDDKEMGALQTQSTFYQPFHWITTGRYMYFTGNYCCWSGPVWWYSGYNLKRLNLISGKMDIVIDGAPGTHAYHFAISTDESILLVFDFRYKNRIRFYRLSDAKEWVIDLPDEILYLGDEAWSPGGKRLALQACYASDPQKGTCDSFLVYLVDLGELRADALVSDTRNLPRPADVAKREFYDISKIEWTDTDNLLLYDNGTDQTWTVPIPLLPTLTPIK
jgi:hypothetical protein